MVKKTFKSRVLLMKKVWRIPAKNSLISQMFGKWRGEVVVRRRGVSTNWSSENSGLLLFTLTCKISFDIGQCFDTVWFCELQNFVNQNKLILCDYFYISSRYTDIFYPPYGRCKSTSRMGANCQYFHLIVLNRVLTLPN